MAIKFGTNGNDQINDLDYSTGVPIDLGTNDTVYGLGGHDIITLNNGNDTAFGGDGNDGFYDFGTGNDRMYGEAGNDTFFAGSGNDLYDGGAGVDWVSYIFSAQVALVDLQAGFALSDGIDTLVSIENVTGTWWNDTILGSDVSNQLHGNGGEDRLDGRGGDDYITAGTGNDTVFGGAGHDTMLGEMGEDWMDGGSGNDVIWAGIGDDIMTGGTGADVFYYSYRNETNEFDTIKDFQHGIDKIDLSAIDARPDIAGNQAFVFDSTQDGSLEEFFDGLSDDWSGLLSGEPGPWINGDTGEIEIRHSGDYTYVYIAYGDGLIDSSIRLDGRINLTASDFIL